MTVQIKKELLKYIVCPDCKEKLRLIEYNDDILQGLLVCPGEHYYPIFNGVPVLIKNDILMKFLDINEEKKFRTACHDLKIKFIERGLSEQKELLLKKSYINWSMQWDIYKMKDTIWDDRKTFLEHIPLDTDEFGRYKTILEIGCGTGRDIQHLAVDNKLIFGIDISNSVYYAHKRYKMDDNIFLLRCDVNYLPFNDDFFDFIYADHVIHHIHNLEVCFKEIERVSKKDNTFIFNLYSKENNLVMGKIIEPFKNVIIKRLPTSLIHIISNLPAIALWFTIKLVYSPIHKYLRNLYKLLPLSQHMVFWFAFNYKCLRLTCFDLLHAPIVGYFSSEDIDQLCKNTLLDLEKKYLLRQTLWICKGKFRK